MLGNYCKSHYYIKILIIWNWYWFYFRLLPRTYSSYSAWRGSICMISFHGKYVIKSNLTGSIFRWCIITFMKQNCHWEVDQEVPQLLWNDEDNYYLLSSLTLDPILSHLMNECIRCRSRPALASPPSMIYCISPSISTPQQSYASNAV
jgi:hypothetical protein